jgi:hypothetical protein
VVRAHSALAYRLAALVLVAGYIAAFDFWRILLSSLGAGGAEILPVALTVFAAIGAAAIGLHLGGRGSKVKLRAVVTGVAIALGALFLSDPAFPAKRIHVLEYAVLALVVGRALCVEIGGRALLRATALATAVLGSHDELVQGLLPDRSFGLRDFAIDAVSGIAGVAIGYGLALFPAAKAGVEDRFGSAQWLALGILTAGWLALMAAMPRLVDAPMPLWPAVPLATGSLAWQMASAGAPATAARRTLAILAVLMLATATEPILAHAIPLDFH